MNALYQRLRSKNDKGIPSGEAVQLFLWIYCTLGVLPEELRREKIGEEELILTFSALASDGYIIAGGEMPQWSLLKDALLSKNIHLDQSFPQRAKCFF